MSTDRSKCLFVVKDGSEGQRSIAILPIDKIPALAGRALSFELEPDSTSEHAETFARVLRRMVSCLVVNRSNGP